MRAAATAPLPTAKSLPLDRRTVWQVLGQFSVPDGDKRTARSPKPAQRLVPLHVLGLGCSLNTIARIRLTHPTVVPINTGIANLAADRGGDAAHPAADRDAELLGVVGGALERRLR